MKYHNQSGYRVKLIGMLIISFLFCIGATAQDKKKKEKKTIEVTLRVGDEAGIALPNARIVVGEGLIHAETDKNGEFTFKGRPDEIVTVSCPGYEKSISIVSDLSVDGTISLKGAKLFKTTEDVIPLPFSYNYKRNTTGSYFVLTSEDLEKYPSNDLRNALVGLVPGLEVCERDGSTGTSAEETRGSYRITNKVDIYGRNFSPIWVIDDMPIDITEMPLDPQEVESVTFINDIVGKTMYGAQGGNGVIFVKTKRGKKNERILNVNAEAGVSMVDRFPEWTTGGDYARLNNQARVNSGLSPLYDETAIREYDKNDPYNKIYPSVNFRDLMLKDTKSYQRVNVSSTGGNNFVQYYAYLGYSGEGDIFKIGHTADYNRLNARANVDMHVNDYIKVQFDFFGGLSLRRSPNYGYNSNYTNDDGNTNTALDINEFSSAIGEIRSTPPVAFPVYASFDEETGLPWYGVHANYKSNPIGNLVDNGYYTETGRTGTANAALDYDLSHLVKGLKSRTSVGFSLFNLTRIGKAERYIAYIATPNADKTDVTLSKVWDAIDMPGQAKLHDYYSQRFSGYETVSYDRSFGLHAVNTALTYTIAKLVRDRVENPLCQQNVNWMGMYTYDSKYGIQGAIAYAGTQSLIGKNKYRWYPSVGLSWVMSEEKFMKNLTFLDFLKIRAEYGELGYESSTPSTFQYEDKWLTGTGSAFGPHTSNRWFGNNIDDKVYTATYNKVGNPDLNWEIRKEFSAGFDAQMLKNRLNVGFSYYNILRDQQQVRPSNLFPLTTGLLAIPLMNYGSSRYYGVELDLKYTDKIGDFKFSIGGMATIRDSKIVKQDEPNYRNEYQRRTGTPTDAYFGLEYLGQFASDEDANKIPQLFDESLSKGDLKYTDLNKDGVVDNNDQKQIGHTSARLIYSLSLQMSYKNFDLTVIGNGRAFYDIPITNAYFWNGWGDDNYSKFVKENIGGDYPKLTYYKVNNNFQGSSFWLRNGSFFKIQNIELAYNLPASATNVLGIRAARFFVRGANLLTISGIKDVDPESMNSGIDRYPLYMTFTGGLKLTF